MNCPKCGYLQEERLDCLKCGVVFAKYFALHSPESFDAQESMGFTGAAQEEPPLPDAAQLQEIRLNLRDLQQRFHELEFERAERRRLRGEIRSLDERFQDRIAQLDKRQETLEHCLAEMTSQPSPASRDDLAGLREELQILNPAALLARIDQLESSLRPFTGPEGVSVNPSLLQLIPRLDERLTEIEHGMADLLEGVVANSNRENPDRVESLMTSMEEMRSALQNVTFRYSEIGELKKNHLVLQNMLESVQQEAESLRRESVQGTLGRIVELEKEVLAQKAELRKAYEHMEELESRPTPAGGSDPAPESEELELLREEIAMMSRRHAEERDRLQAGLDTLMVKVVAGSKELAQLPGALESFSAQIRRLDQQVQPLSRSLEKVSGATDGTPAKIAALGEEITALRSDLLEAQAEVRSLHLILDGNRLKTQGNHSHGESDMEVIRENLDDIRRFMADLSRKL